MLDLMYCTSLEEMKQWAGVLRAQLFRFPFGVRRTCVTGGPWEEKETGQIGADKS